MESDVGRTEKYGWYEQCALLIISPSFFRCIFDADRSWQDLYCMKEFRKEKQLFLIRFLQAQVVETTRFTDE
jgi:hypothetical protein